MRWPGELVWIRADGGRYPTSALGYDDPTMRFGSAEWFDVSHPGLLIKVRPDGCCGVLMSGRIVWFFDDQLRARR